VPVGALVSVCYICMHVITVVVVNKTPQENIIQPGVEDKTMGASSRARVNLKRIGIYQFNSNSIPELEQELELKDLQLNEKDLIM